MFYVLNMKSSIAFVSVVFVYAKRHWFGHFLSPKTMTPVHLSAPDVTHKTENIKMDIVLIPKIVKLI